MPSNWQEQILECTVRLSAEADISEKWQQSWVCCKDSSATRPKHWLATPWRRGGQQSLTTAREDRQLVRMVRDNGLILSPVLRIGMIRRFRKKSSVWNILKRFLDAGYRSKCPTRCPKLTLKHRWHRRVMGSSGTGSTVSLVMSLAPCVVSQWWSYACE